MTPNEHAVCMGMDALRLCIGQQPTNFSTKDVIAWMRGLSVHREECPECGADLDTGWECTSCDFDGSSVATKE